MANELTDFLIKHRTKILKKESTHTRIGEKCKKDEDKKNRIWGGDYHIDKDELPIFYDLYYDHVFVKKHKEYLTEKQLADAGPILIDLDFKYDVSVRTRQHNSGHISDIAQEYVNEIHKMLKFEDGDTFPIYVMEKTTVNALPDKTKDGIHMIIGIHMDRLMQIMLREKMIARLSEVLNLNLANNYEDVIDAGIAKGVVNWPLYGSRKPHHDNYKLTYIMDVTYSEEDEQFEFDNNTRFCLKDEFNKLSAQYSNHSQFQINPKFAIEYDARVELNSRAESGKKKCVTSSADDDSQIKSMFTKMKYNFNNMSNIYDNIANESDLDEAIGMIMDNLAINEFNIKELHEYTQILPEKYYKSGSSHLLNRQVAFGLKHRDDRLFLSWVKLRSKADDFDYADIPNLYQQWCNFSRKENGITHKSIMYWAKQDAFEEYKKVKMNTIDSCIVNTMFGAGDWDYANVLYYMFKDKFVCVSLKNGSVWYIFKKHRWEKDDGQTLRKYISTKLFKLYSEKQNQMLQEVQNYDPSDEEHGKIQRKIKQLANICIKFKNSSDKNKIMREASELFFDADFIKNMDSNPYLLCFDNGVYDFKTKEFRDGYPTDYITKSTNINYIKYNPLDVELSPTYESIDTFMKQLFPEPELCKYMWEHLASTLIGDKKEQVFNIYKGSGSNGKSILTELMSLCLGDYKGTVPVNLITDKRTSIGGTTSEIIALKGVRYAVMQEPSAGMTLNEGIMKEITSATEPLVGRALWNDSESFIPQFSLVICLNVLLNIKSNDDGSWRRIKQVDFKSKFISEGEIHYHDNNYVFPKDKGLKNKLSSWAPLFIGMLVDIAIRTNGEVLDCPQVVEASNKYRESQDCLSKYINSCIKKEIGKYVKKTELNNNFKIWYTENIGTGRIPKLQDLEELMVKKFGPLNTKTNKWSNITIATFDDEDDDESAEIS